VGVVLTVDVAPVAGIAVETVDVALSVWRNS